MKTRKQFLLFIFHAALLVACSRPSSAPPASQIDQALVGTIAAQTLEALSVKTQTPIPSATLAHTPAETPTVTPTYSVPVLQFYGDTNCRKGPGQQYDVVTVVLSGQKAEATGISENGNYWLIKVPFGDKTCWVASDYVKTSGSIMELPTVKAPPTTTPIPPLAPVWSSYSYTCQFASGGNTITMILAWTDRANNEDGYIVYRDRQSVANLAPDSTTYMDVAFVATGNTLSYTVEVFSKAGRASSSTVNAGCQ